MKEIEDLIPAPIAVEAARSYATRLLGFTTDDAKSLTARAIDTKLGEGDGTPVCDAVAAAFADAFDAGIDKLGFAKEVVRYVETVEDSRTRPPGLRALEDNFAVLIAHLADLLGTASADEVERRTAKRTDEIVRAFLADHPDGATRDIAGQTLREIDASLEGSLGDDAVARQLGVMRRTFKLDVAPLSPVEEYPAFVERLKGLKVARRDAYRDGSA